MGEKIELKYDFRCESVYSELNTLIRRISSIQKNAHTDRGYSYPYDTAVNLEGLKTILLNILYQKTNIKHLMNKNRYYFGFNDIDKALLGVYDNSKKQPYERFFSNLDEFFNTPERSFSFIFPVNLRINLQNDTRLNKILDIFEIKELEKTDLNDFLDKTKLEEDKSKNKSINKRLVFEKPTKDEILFYLKRYPLIILVNVKARNLDFSERFAKSSIDSFFGLLSFADNFLHQNMLHATYFGLNHHFTDINHGNVIILNENKITYPYKRIIADSLTEKVNLIDFKNYEGLIEMANDLDKIKNEYFRDLLNSAFRLYYEASHEKSVKYSFLNFWIIAETLIKAGKARTNEEVKSTMKSLIKDDILNKRIDFLDKRRNGMVHRGDIIRLDERDLIKIIVDILIATLMKDMPHLENKQQLHFYLLNIKAKNKDINDYLNALKLLKSQNESLS